jgi:hypothetical protein
VEVELIGDDWGPPDRNDWESMPRRNDQDQPSGDTWGFTPGLSYEDRIRTALFEAGTRRMEPQGWSARDGRDRGSAAPWPWHPVHFGDVTPVRGIAPRHLQNPSTRWY